MTKSLCQNLQKFNFFKKKYTFKILALNRGQNRPKPRNTDRSRRELSNGVIRKGLSLNKFYQKAVKFNTSLTPQKKNDNDSQPQIGYPGPRRMS